MRATAEIGTNLVYAAIQEFGGTIHPKNAPFLVFQLDDGTWIHATEVTIPAQPYLRPAFDYMRGPAIKTIGEVFEKLVIARHYL